MDYNSFYEIFLNEMPQRINGGNPFPYLSLAIDQLISNGAPVQHVINDIYQVGDFYWAGSEDGSLKKICMSASLTSNLFKVNATGKNPEYKSKPPFAMDFYLTLSNILKRGIKFSSDNVLSDGGFNIWKHIFDNGHSLLVYDSSIGSYKSDNIRSYDELMTYFSDKSASNKYQFVIDGINENINLLGKFEIMEWKRLSGYPLEDLFKRK